MPCHKRTRRRPFERNLPRHRSRPVSGGLQEAVSRPPAYLAEVCGVPCLDRGQHAPVQTGHTADLCQLAADG
eukprot:NODE_2377_length_1135_cov_15.801105_g1974_i0.p4 GENE.NODE_2377_length_1135_cov_15.801105_g1974_i0~~NODE_2377_length_1135_cov_15.801105_g1974_i0.p4  ORF type:complete len:72 (-),score=0.61 NODE_2377_length_1135_cov_15.801105_g1974_i0:594-809(-)